MSPRVASWLPTVFFVPLAAFALYRRVRRTFGRQLIAPKRMVLRMLLLSVIGIVFLASMPTLNGFAAGAAGASLGVVLAIYGLKHTQFDVSAAGRFYTPNPWIGMVVTALFLGRFAARTFTVYEARTLAGPSVLGTPFQRSPLTLAVFFLMAAYYVAFYGGVLRKARSVRVAQLPPDSGSMGAACDGGGALRDAALDHVDNGRRMRLPAAAIPDSKRHRLIMSRTGG